VTGLQRRIRRHKSLRAIATGGTASSTFLLGIDLTAPAHAWVTQAPVVLVIALFAAWEWRNVSRLQAKAKAEAGPAERPKTQAEAVAEAVEARRQRQWDAIADRAYRAMGGAVRATPAPASKPPMTALPPARTQPVAGATTMAEFTAGIARLSAAAGGCAHPDAEPVDLITGERVAWVCPDCPAELPASWRP